MTTKEKSKEYSFCGIEFNWGTLENRFKFRISYPNSAESVVREWEDEYKLDQSKFEDDVDWDAQRDYLVLKLERVFSSPRDLMMGFAGPIVGLITDEKIGQKDLQPIFEILGLELSDDFPQVIDVPEEHAEELCDAIIEFVQEYDWAYLLSSSVEQKNLRAREFLGEDWNVNSTSAFFELEFTMPAWIKYCYEKHSDYEFDFDWVPDWTYLIDHWYKDLH